MWTTLKDNKAWFVLVFAILFYCLDYYFRISPSLIVKPLMDQYNVSALGIGGFASAFYLGYLTFQLPAGILFDRFAFHWVMTTSVLLCTGCYILFFYVDTYWLGYALRWVIGAASAFSFIGVLYYARTRLPDRYFTVTSGITIAAGTLSAAVAEVASAYAMRFLPWREVLVFLSLWGLVVATFIYLPMNRVAPLRAIASQATELKTTLRQVGSFCRNKVLVVNALLGGLFYLPTTIFASLWGVPFLQDVYGLDKTGASTGITLIFAGWAVGSPLIGLLGERIKRYSRLIALFSLLAMVMTLLIVYCPQIIGWGVFPCLFLFGLFSSAQVLVWLVFKRECEPQVAGIGAAFSNMLIMACGAVFHLMVGALMGSRLIFTGHGSIDYPLGLAIMPAALLLVLLGSPLVMRRNK